MRIGVNFRLLTRKYRQLGRGARLHADGGAVQLLDRFHPGRLLHQKAGAVIEIHPGEQQAQIRLAAQRPGRVAHQQVHLARLQRGEAVGGGQRHELHLGRIAQDGGRHGAAGIRVQAAHHPLAVGQREARHAAGHAADKLAARLDGVDGGRAGALRLRRARKQRAGQQSREDRD